MDYQSAFAISAAGMSAERLRVDVAALNLANANTPWAANGAGYQPLRVQASVRAAPGARSFETLMDQGIEAARTLSVAPYRAPARRVHEPGHPQANKDGFVLYPGVDSLTEMMTLMVASRAYEADVAAFNAAKSMAMKALEIGGRS
ncbi:flagellar basal body rod protein FlgC [Achromobacter sp. SLBN-14]|uniref:flagellar basal body rod protein FlgC n=1 Tax=Achromobacter sp. SLBN-14 TaxID=2768442 RepID=UPI00115110D0|nr:flagellar basal body rod protein FlgC [Achromobacter sp. SLBN-14]TQJ96164.1 flagellar basal-body rod protein FlgC [Achromobacter sp. SLBN-14]